ncbi:hypothetical protein COX73_00065 [bacterium (Candidatus Gribaldobacteria) CG_4_10_14_0_2_um_filter_36_18]|uniref:Uncharacterized protein n=1 Tax=bacterium (Candidatus Gribaldobacteria) CG_4_10_14_0_2_um_filter_36_18 TaxID=2014264 RepID=A0A2M7VL32_9BACT|nr:MAG: hypothetical protein COX73_00065 [bacterium (Candidatus Gribaldobacteria) CG_4_10_14_0_2_um_filter_36_18]
MSKKNRKISNTDKCIEVLQDLLILELGKEKIPQREIRNIVGVDIHKVNRIIKYLKKEYGGR